MARKLKVPDVTVESVIVPDAQERLARAYDLILRAAARAEERTENPSDAGAPTDDEVVGRG